MSFAPIFLAALGGVIEAIAGKSIEAGPALARRGRLLGMVERQPASAAEQAVTAAVDAARRELVDAYAYSDAALRDDDIRDLLRLLDHPPFAQEVARTLLLRGRPDFDHLRQNYLGAAQSERWSRLQPYLAEFFTGIEERLTTDKELGPILRDTQVLTVQLGMADDLSAIAQASQRMIEFQARMADAGESTASTIVALLQTADRQEASLGEIAQLLAAAKAGYDQRGQTVHGNQQNIGSAQTAIAGNVEHVGDRYYAAPPDPAEQRAIEAERRYLRLLRPKCNRLPLAEENRDPEGQGAARAELVNVYVHLNTTSDPSLPQIFDRLAIPPEKRRSLLLRLQREIADGRTPRKGVEPDSESLRNWLGKINSQEEREKLSKQLEVDAEALAHAIQPLSVLDALAAHPHLVLLGHPGSGKSTFVNHLAYVCAGAVLGDEPEWRAALDNNFSQPIFPLRVILRRWSASLNKSSRAGLPLAYAALTSETGLDQATLERRLVQPGALVLFDGLDEAPAANPDDASAPDRRRLILQSVQDFCTAHPDCRVLVTSRVKPYQQSDRQLVGIPVFTLAELDETRIQRFVENWYSELARIDPERAERAAKAQSRLLTALGNRPELRRMAGTPLLLTMLAAVNTWAGLPESRAQLYSKCVEQLLWEWEKKKDVEEGEDAAGPTALGLVDMLRQEGVELQRADVERVLWELTFHAHAQSGAETADLPADALRKKLAAIHPKANNGWAWANRAVKLMAERGGLLVEIDTDIFTFPHRSFQEYLAARWLLTDTERAKRAAELAESDTWREVILLACGYLTQEGRKEEVQAIIFEMIGGQDFATPESRRRLLTGGAAWLEYNTPHRATGEIGRLLTERIPPRLTALMQERDAPPAQRLEAGLLLADLGDLPPDLDTFVPIAASATLGYDFRIGKYPVTNAQYRHFFDAGGYEPDKPWWTEEAVKEIESWSFNEGWRNGPRYWDDERFNKSTQPVVGVSWYEAAAYCAWLTEELRGAGKIGQNDAVRLPKEAEWMFVASPPSISPHSGGRAGGSLGREYAWGDDFESWRVNCAESGYGQPTPVHMHPGGATPDTGIWDLCGNVWEWSADWNENKYPWLKGGSYYTKADSVRASSRNGLNPWSGLNLFGLRCVVVPGSR